MAKEILPEVSLGRCAEIIKGASTAGISLMSITRQAADFIADDKLNRAQLRVLIPHLRAAVENYRKAIGLSD